MSKRILSTMIALVLVLGMIPLSTVAAFAASLPGWATEAGFNDHNAVWDDGTNTLKLTDDVTVTGVIEPDGDAVLDLNGRTITAAGIACAAVALVMKKRST